MEAEGGLSEMAHPLVPLPRSYTETLEALHRLVVYVVSPAQRGVNDEIILRATAGGLGTFPFGDDGRVVRIEGADLVVENDGGTVARERITSIAAAARLVGIEPDLGQEAQFDVPAPGDVDAPLAIDPEAVAALHGWYAFTEDVLNTIRGEAGPADDPSIVRIWPEHFDSAIDTGSQDAGQRGTYGGSPGDRHYAHPYLYVSPWRGRIDEFFGDPEFKGVSLAYPVLLDEDDPRAAALAFLREARGHITAG
jgi:hypothetical protein